MLSLAHVDHLLTETAIRTPAVRVAQDGAVLPESSYTRSATLAGKPVTGLVDARKALALFDGGATVVFQGLQRYWSPVGDLVAQLTGVHRLELGEAVGVHFNAAQAYVFDASEQLAVAPAWRHTHRLHGTH